jgi:hypothetical protein
MKSLAETKLQNYVAYVHPLSSEVTPRLFKAIDIFEAQAKVVEFESNFPSEFNWQLESIKTELIDLYLENFIEAELSKEKSLNRISELMETLPSDKPFNTPEFWGAKILAHQMNAWRHFKAVIQDIDKDEEPFEVSMEGLLSIINADRSSLWLDYDVNDWEEGWKEWVEGVSYNLISTNQ